MISRSNSSVFPTKLKMKEWVKTVCIARKQCLLDLGKNIRHRNDFALCRTFYSSRFLMGKRNCWTINIISSLSCISYPVIPFQIKDLFKGFCSSSFFTAWKWCCCFFFLKKLFSREMSWITETMGMGNNCCYTSVVYCSMESTEDKPLNKHVPNW